MAIALFYALAMAWLGFAHQPVIVVTAPSSLERIAYILPDGSLPDLCIPQADDPGRSGHLTTCEACLVSSGHGPIAAPPGLALPATRIIARLEIAPNDPPRSATREQARARGPPIA